MTYRYFSEYGKLLPLPEVEKPRYFYEQCYMESIEYRKRLAKHQEWLSKGIPVPDEHLKFFKVERDESEFGKDYQVFYNKIWRYATPDCYESYEGEKRIVAIPKESKEQEDSPIGSEIGIWLQSQLRFFTSIEGEIVKVSDYAGGLSIKFKNGNGYTLKLSKQCQVSADEFPRESTTTRRG
jgi:hypothetical protein